MFAELLADYIEQPAAALDQELRRLELAARELDARRGPTPTAPRATRPPTWRLGTRP